MRVLHCLYDDPANPWVGGGGAMRLREIYRRLDGQLDVTLLCGRFPGASEEDGDGVRVRRAGSAAPYAWSRLTYGLAATRLLRREPYDAAVFEYSAYTPLDVPRGRPVGVMLTQLAGPTARARWPALPAALVAAWERRQLRRARSVAAVSGWLLDAVRPLLPDGVPARVVGAGPDDRYFAVRREERDWLLFYGRFDVFQKGIDVLLDAMVALRRTHPAVGLKLCGRGREGARIAALVAERGLGGAVEVVTDPSQPSMAALMAGALALVMPSRFEGFGIIAVEAMAAGVPIVASAVDSLPGLVGDAGVYAPAGDADALAAAIAGLLDAPSRRAALSAAGRGRARGHSWDRVAGEHLAWLAEVARLGGSGAGPERGSASWRTR